MSGDVIFNLQANYAARCGMELQAAGYAPPTEDAQIIRAYSNVRHRRVEQRPRKVHKATYTVPGALLAGENIFLAAVEAGDDLRPYQSTKLAQADFDDGMLNDFGIQHFHLGVLPHPTRLGFMARTEPVLFALVRDDDLYSLGCFAHGAWTQTALLDLIHATWPQLIAGSSPNSVPGSNIIGLAHNYSGDEVKKLRAAGINALTQRPDGTIHFGPGGGVAMDGGSAKVSREMTGIVRLIRQIQQDLEPKILAQVESGDLAKPVTVGLEQVGSKTYAMLNNGHVRVDLRGQLSVPPL